MLCCMPLSNRCTILCSLKCTCLIYTSETQHGIEISLYYSQHTIFYLLAVNVECVKDYKWVSVVLSQYKFYMINFETIVHDVHGFCWCMCVHMLTVATNQHTKQ